MRISSVEDPPMFQITAQFDPVYLMGQLLPISFFGAIRD
jgi:hypothetical protein